MILVDLVLNIVLLVDFSFRVRMIGIGRFFKTMSNIFDFVIIMGTTLSFVLFFMCKMKTTITLYSAHLLTSAL